MVQPGDPPDAHEPGSRRQTFAHWDAPLIAWLEGNGYEVDYCTDLDLHQDPGLLDALRAAPERRTRRVLERDDARAARRVHAAAAATSHS